jgi:hypothetical protein
MAHVTLINPPNKIIIIINKISQVTVNKKKQRSKTKIKITL